MKIVLLAEFNTELCVEYLKELLKRKMTLHSIILIGDSLDEDRRKIVLDRTGGLYKKPTLSEVLLGIKVPVFISDDINSQYTYELLDYLEPDIVVFEGSRIISLGIFDMPSIGFLNCHMGILPYFRGCSCVEWSILKDRPVGATCHFVEKDVDAGPIVYRAILGDADSFSYHEIRTKGIYLAARVMAEGVEQLSQHGVRKETCVKYPKGPWHSPMRDKDMLRMVTKKTLEGTYIPKVWEDVKDIPTINIELPQI